MIDRARVARTMAGALKTYSADGRETGSFSVRLDADATAEATAAAAPEAAAGDGIAKGELTENGRTWSFRLRMVPETDPAGGGSVLGSLEIELLAAGAASGETASGDAVSVSPGILWTFSGWSAGNYLMAPAGAYRGNRFPVAYRPYPPTLEDQDIIGPDTVSRITDLPRLSAEPGKSHMELRAGDLSAPWACMDFPRINRAFMLQGVHWCAGDYTGFTLEESEDRSRLVLGYWAPLVRSRMYGMCAMREGSDDLPRTMRAGDRVALSFRCYDFPCASIPGLLERFFQERKRPMPGNGGCPESEGGAEAPTETTTAGPAELPLSAAFAILEQKYNSTQWNEKSGWYRVSPEGTGGNYGDWQAGWVGGGMTNLPLFLAGNDLSKERSLRTMDSVFSTLQATSGFIRPMVSGSRSLGDDFRHPERTGTMLIRKNADLLLFAVRFAEACGAQGVPVKDAWHRGIERLADAFVRLWKKYGQFGHWVDLDTEEILIGGTACAGAAVGALAAAARFLGKESYMEIARAAARLFNDQFLQKGYSNGGPGEILQAPDSESAFGLLESYVELYERTGEREWLPMAETAAQLCSTWCVSYDFNFPQDSEFGRLGMRTLGSVWASVQNKHSAPGICTFSGAALVKLYRATGNKLYLELARDICRGITQYLSRDDRPIRSWDGEYLPAGWMCERVNMSDWESKSRIGGVFYGSCWCETSCLLTYTEVPGVYLRSDTGEVTCFDNLNARLENDGRSGPVLIVHNPTRFAARTSVLVESAADLGQAWGSMPLQKAVYLEIPAGKKNELRLVDGRLVP